MYSHFPINVSVSGKNVEIRNYLGEKLVRRVKLCDGVEYVRTAGVKDQIELSGNDINVVSLTAANIQQTTKDVTSSSTASTCRGRATRRSTRLRRVLLRF